MNGQGAREQRNLPYLELLGKSVIVSLHGGGWSGGGGGHGDCAAAAGNHKLGC